MTKKMMDNSNDNLELNADEDDFTDEELMELLVDIAEDPRVTIRAAFLPDPDGPESKEDNPPLTHQVLILTVGALVSISQPVTINKPFRATFVDEEVFIPATASIH